MENRNDKPEGAGSSPVLCSPPEVYCDHPGCGWMGDYDDTDTSRLVEVGTREFCDPDDSEAERCCPDCGFTDLREDSRFREANNPHKLPSLFPTLDLREIP